MMKSSNVNSNFYFYFFCFLLWIPLETQARPEPLCYSYWHYRKLGQDWPYHPSMDHYDQTCLSQIVVARDLNNQCAVTTLKTYKGHTSPFHASLNLSWFDCKVGQKEFQVGDVILGEIKEECEPDICYGCPVVVKIGESCRQTFHPH